MKPVAALRHWAAQSLLRRLWLWMTVSVVVVGLGTAALSYFFAYEEAYELQDTQLRQIASLVHRWGEVPGNALTPAGADVDKDARIVVQRLGAPPGSQGLNLPADLPDGMQVVHADGHDWRVFVRTGPSGRIAVAQRTDLRNDAAIDSAQRTLFPLLGLVPLLALLAAVVVQRALRPLRRLAQSVDARSPDDLRPLPEADVPREVLPFVRSINRLLSRLATAMEQQRRFVANAAHELRTPIAVLGMQIDNLQSLLQAPQARERFDTLKQGLRRARTVVEQLLTLARSQGAQAVHWQPVDALAVVRDVIADLLPLAESRTIDLGLDQAEAVTLQADPAMLHTLLRNAVDNAVRYTPSGGRVDLRVRREPSEHGVLAVIEVQDTGPGIPASELPRVLQPFVRLHPEDGEGTGLGLPIIMQTAQRLGGRVTLHSPPGGGLLLRYEQSIQPAINPSLHEAGMQ